MGRACILNLEQFHTLLAGLVCQIENNLIHNGQSMCCKMRTISYTIGMACVLNQEQFNTLLAVHMMCIKSRTI